METPPTSKLNVVGVPERGTSTVASTSKLPGSPVKYWCHMPAMLVLVRLGKLREPAAVSWGSMLSAFAFTKVSLSARFLTVKKGARVARNS
jgi:hypothetical protein